MRRFLIWLAGLALTGAVPLGARGAEPDWRPLDPANTLVIETTKGRIVVEMAPRLAPLAVERVKRLAREGVYDGLQFHRVIEGFVDQTGNPNNRDGGTSAYPDLPAEFSVRLPADAGAVIVQTRSDGVEGFLGPVPIAGASAAEQALGSDHRLRVWGAYCEGVAGMGRQGGSTPPTARSSSCASRRGGSTTNTPSGAGWFRAWMSCRRWRWASRPRSRTSC